MEWLNGPLVWAIDDGHQPMYLFPRECPRILLWRTPTSTAQDIKRFFGSSECRMLAYIQRNWLTRLQSADLHRYELPQTTFRTLHDAGMWVSGDTVVPIDCMQIDNLPERLIQNSVELRLVDDLTTLGYLWSSSLHASGIRLRNLQ